jgi:hypothetical protein
LYHFVRVGASELHLVLLAFGREIIFVFGQQALGGYLKSGHTWSLKNRPTGLAEDLMVFPSLGRFERRHLLADDFVFVPCYLW